MKSKISLKNLVVGSSLLLVAGSLMTGCATTESSNGVASDNSYGMWSGRVGNYTYAQATADYGTPTESHKLADGGTTAEWLTRRNTINPAPPSGATQIRAGGIDQPTGSNANTFKNEYLRLNFDATGKLTKWSRVYR